MRLFPWFSAIVISSSTVAAAPLKTPPVTLAPQGLIFGAGKPSKATFGLPTAAALKVVSAALGKPLKRGTYPDCGQGQPMGYATYKGGLELAFYKGKFSGWTLDDHGSAMWRSARGLAIGSSRKALSKAYPNVQVDDGSLGIMFVVEDDLSGFLDSVRPNAKVTSIFAGETCMVS